MAHFVICAKTELRHPQTRDVCATPDSTPSRPLKILFPTLSQSQGLKEPVGNSHALRACRFWNTFIVATQWYDSQSNKRINSEILIVTNQ